MASGKKLVQINCSEIASLVGRHKHQDTGFTKDVIWFRYDKDTFVYSRAQMIPEKINELLTGRFPIEGDILEATLRHIYQNISCQDIWNEIVACVKREFLDSKKDSNFLSTLNLLQPTLGVVKNLAAEETCDVDTKIKEFCQSKGVTGDAKVEAAVTAVVNKTRGVYLEDRAIKTFSRKNVTAVNKDVTYERVVQLNGVSFFIKGKTDADTSDTIIEVKNRRRRFFNPEYDKIQLFSYMYISNKKKGILLQRLNGENRETSFNYDEEYYLPILHDIANFVNNLLYSVYDLKQEMQHGEETKN